MWILVRSTLEPPSPHLLLQILQKKTRQYHKSKYCANEWILSQMIILCLFVCVEILRPYQPIRVMSSVVSLPNNTFSSEGFKSSKWLISTCAHSFGRNWQMPFLNQQKGENDHRKYVMINCHERMLPTRWGSNPQSPDHQSDTYPTEPPRLAWGSDLFLQIQLTLAISTLLISNNR